MHAAVKSSCKLRAVSIYWTGLLDWTTVLTQTAVKYLVPGRTEACSLSYLL